MALWAILTWGSSVIVFAGFVVGMIRVPYVECTEPDSDGVCGKLNGTEIKYHYSKLSSCDDDGYCLPDDFMGLYNCMLAFAFLSTVLLFLQGCAAWLTRLQYLDPNLFDKKDNLDGKKKKKKKGKKKDVEAQV